MPHDTSMVSMKMTAKESKAETMPSTMKAPEYPYGLRIRLDEEAIKKLGMKELPPVDKVVKLYAAAYVCNVSSHDSSEGGSNRSMELQITDLALMPEKEPEEPSKKLYGE